MLRFWKQEQISDVMAEVEAGAFRQLVADMNLQVLDTDDDTFTFVR